MARLFNGSSQYLQVDAAVLSAYPLGMAGWFRSEKDTSGQAIVAICNSTQNTPQWALIAHGGLPNDPVSVLVRANSGGENHTVSATGYTVNTWHHAAGFIRSTSYRKAYIDGVAGAATTNTVAAPTLNRTSIGFVRRPSPTYGFDGRLAEIGLWNLANWGASDAAREAAFDRAVATMAKGVRPLQFPVGLVGYWPVWGDHSPEIDLHPRHNDANDYSMTVTGATKANHAPVKLYSPSYRMLVLRNLPPLVTFRQRRRGRVFVQREG